jgi:predicted phosphoribosyltransferase
MSPVPLFRDRAEAGERLAQAILAELNQLSDDGTPQRAIVYALPRGGVPVAAPVARLLHCPLTLLVAKKIVRPESPELALGAVTADGCALWSSPCPLSRRSRKTLLYRTRAKAKSQWERLAHECPPVDPQGAIALLIDDGIATGMTMATAAASLRSPNCPAKLMPDRVWICTPLAPPELADILPKWCDRAVVLETPKPFLSVSRFYEKFPQVNTDRVRQYLREAR